MKKNITSENDDFQYLSHDESQLPGAADSPGNNNNNNDSGLDSLIQDTPGDEGTSSPAKLDEEAAIATAKHNDETDIDDIIQSILDDGEDDNQTLASEDFDTQNQPENIHTDHVSEIDLLRSILGEKFQEHQADLNNTIDSDDNSNYYSQTDKNTDSQLQQTLIKLEMLWDELPNIWPAINEHPDKKIKIEELWQSLKENESDHFNSTLIDINSDGFESAINEISNILSSDLNNPDIIPDKYSEPEEETLLGNSYEETCSETDQVNTEESDIYTTTLMDDIYEDNAIKERPDNSDATLISSILSDTDDSVIDLLAGYTNESISDLDETDTLNDHINLENSDIDAATSVSEIDLGTSFKDSPESSDTDIINSILSEADEPISELLTESAIHSASNSNETNASTDQSDTETCDFDAATQVALLDSETDLSDDFIVDPGKSDTDIINSILSEENEPISELFTESVCLSASDDQLDTETIDFETVSPATSQKYETDLSDSINNHLENCGTALTDNNLSETDVSNFDPLTDPVDISDINTSSDTTYGLADTESDLTESHIADDIKSIISENGDSKGLYSFINSDADDILTDSITDTVNTEEIIENEALPDRSSETTLENSETGKESDDLTPSSEDATEAITVANDTDISKTRHYKYSGNISHPKMPKPDYTATLKRSPTPLHDSTNSSSSQKTMGTLALAASIAAISVALWVYFTPDELKTEMAYTAPANDEKIPEPLKQDKKYFPDQESNQLSSDTGKKHSDSSRMSANIEKPVEVKKAEIEPAFVEYTEPAETFSDSTNTTETPVLANNNLVDPEPVEIIQADTEESVTGYSEPTDYSPVSNLSDTDTLSLAESDQVPHETQKTQMTREILQTEAEKSPTDYTEAIEYKTDNISGDTETSALTNVDIRPTETVEIIQINADQSVAPYLEPADKQTDYAETGRINETELAETIHQQPAEHTPDSSIDEIEPLTGQTGTRNIPESEATYYVTQNNELETIDSLEPVDEPQIDNLMHSDLAISNQVLTAKGMPYYWALNLSSIYETRKPAEDILDLLHSKNIPAEIKLINLNGKIWHRIRIKGFVKKQQALDYMRVVRRETNIKKYWISKISPQNNNNE